MRALTPLLAGVTLLAFAGVACSGPTIVPPTGARVVLISLDGLRPDAVTQANMPALVRMAKEGAGTLNAQTVLPSLTLPAHTSMMTGLVPDRHGIKINDDSTAGTERVMVPTIFDIATQAGFTSAMFVGKAKLAPIVHVGSPTKLNMPPIGAIWKADTVAQHVITFLATADAAARPSLMFIHLPDIDLAGHAFGWMSPQYITAVKHTDAVLETLWTSLKATFGADLIVIVTADHGGLGTGHSDGSPLARTVPWIAWGRDVSPKILTANVRGVDVGPTMLWVLGLTPPMHWDGVPVRSAFPTLLH